MSKTAKKPKTNAEGLALVRKTIKDAALAKHLGISRTAVGKWTTVPSNRVEEVAKATGLPPEWIRPQPYA